MNYSSESYQSARPTANTPFTPLSTSLNKATEHHVPSSSSTLGGASLGASLGGSASQNPFANASYRSPLQDERIRVNKYETSLGWRVDVEAAVCYIFCGVSGALLLIFEQKNDYVRFHAWQSLLLNALLFFLLFLSGWILPSLLVTWIGLLQLASNLFLAIKAYKLGATLERYHLAYVGELAAEWVDTE